MPKMSETPMTDTAAFDQVCCEGEYPVKRKYYTEGDYVEADFARKLELELAEEREANRIAAEHVGVRIFIDPLNRHIAVNERAEQAERERDELLDELGLAATNLEAAAQSVEHPLTRSVYEFQVRHIRELIKRVRP